MLYKMIFLDFNGKWALQRPLISFVVALDPLSK
jgi:hypothetical protein